MNDGNEQKCANTCLFQSVALPSVLFAVIAVASVWAQTATTRSMSGVVTHPSATVVFGAPIKPDNIDIGSSTFAMSNARGSYDFSLLPPERYSVSANVAGFQKILKSAPITLGTRFSVNSPLCHSEQSASVDINNRVTGVQTERTNFPTNVNTQQILSPSFGNDLSAVALIASGLGTNTIGGAVLGAGNYDFIGLPSNSNLFTYHGANDNRDLNIDNSCATNLSLGLNDVQETSLVTNRQRGQLGRLAGANINHVSKPGTASYDRDAEYWWNGRASNLNDYFWNHPNPIAGGDVAPWRFVKANQYATSFSGPIKKDKSSKLIRFGAGFDCCRFSPVASGR